jgi:hypothetical protein
MSKLGVSSCVYRRAMLVKGHIHEFTAMTRLSVTIKNIETKKKVSKFILTTEYPMYNVDIAMIIQIVVCMAFMKVIIFDSLHLTSDEINLFVDSRFKKDTMKNLRMVVLLLPLVIPVCSKYCEGLCITFGNQAI